MMDDRQKPFEDMARRIVDNISNGFAGAAVIVLPEGDPIELLMLDPKPDVAHFISAVAQRLQDIAKELDKQRMASVAYGR